MKAATLLTILFAGFYGASAKVLNTPIFANQVLSKKTPGDCPFGVVTSQGCGPLRTRGKPFY